jgi:hypothetical protein
MTGRMESMENLTRDVAGFAKQRKVFHPSHRPLEIVTTIPTFPQPRLRRFSLANQKQGDISTRLTKGTFLFGLDTDGWGACMRLERYAPLVNLSPCARSKGLRNYV